MGFRSAVFSDCNCAFRGGLGAVMGILPAFSPVYSVPSPRVLCVLTHGPSSPSPLPGDHRLRCPPMPQTFQMYMSMGNWGQAYNEFYEGFRNYQEAGNPNAKVAHDAGERVSSPLVASNCCRDSELGTSPD